ncbi:MAG: tetratricopeptide repeat protein [Terriglobales bacterium]
MQSSDPSLSTISRDTTAQIPVAQLLEKNGAMEALVCALTALAYLATLGFGFVYDDKPVIVQNTAIRSWRALAAYFVPKSAAGVSGGTFFRPVTILWLRLNYMLFGLEPAGWHFAMLIGHVLATWLVFVLVTKLAANRTTAAIAALLFGLHPVHVENVAWLSSVNDLLMTVLLLGSFLAYLKFRDSRNATDSNSIAWIAASIFLFLLALLSKETAAVFPMVILGFAAIRPDSRSLAADSCSADNANLAEDASITSAFKASLWSAGKEAIVSVPYFAVLAAYLVIRRLMLHAMANPIAPLSWSTMILTWPSVMWFDLKHLLLPITSSEFYSLSYVTAPGVSNFLLPALFLLIAFAAVCYAVTRLKNPRLGIFALLWIVLSILPTLYLRAVAPDNFVHDRFLYLPSVGLVILLALAAEHFPARRAGNRGATVKWAIVGVLCATGIVGTAHHQMQWANNLLLYQSGMASAPQNLVVQDNLANELSDAGRYDEATRIYLRVLQRDPWFWSANYNLGYAYYRAGRFNDAESYLNRAIQIDGRDPDQFIYLARAQMQQGKLNEAAVNAERALQRSPMSPGFHLILGKIFEDSGQRQQAIAEYKLEMLHHPENMLARRELARMLSQ